MISTSALPQAPTDIQVSLRIEAELRSGLLDAAGAAALHRTARRLERAGFALPLLLQHATDWPEVRPALLTRLDAYLDDADDIPPTPWLCALQHIRLHLAAECVSPDALAARAEKATAQGQEGLREWRRLSNERFSQVHCIDWSPGLKYCRQLGYVFEGREYPIKYLGERHRHQQRAWEALCEGPARPLLLSVGAWQQLSARAQPYFGSVTPASRTA